jgi:glycosyltransferase involved in cell wall biosynthesis
MDATRDPRIAVIVPVRDRRDLLATLLDALVVQTYDDFEVVVVDDHSTDGTPEVALAAAAAGLSVRVVTNDGHGAYAGRRTGVAASSAPWIAFTDSDCVPAADWLKAGAAALESGADVVNGLTEPTRPPAPLERTMWSGEEGLYPTCNVFYRRSAYEAAGGFDAHAADRFGFAEGTVARRMGFGEDTLLGWRVRRAGRAVYAPDAVVRHQVLAQDLADTWRRTWMMVAFPALFREVPELRAGPLCRHGVLLNTPGRYPLYGVLAGAALRRPALAAAAAGWWVLGRARRVRGGPGTRAQKVGALPAQLGLDVVTTAVLVAGSARARSVVL